ncbi:hypothetical protein DNTS_006316 [Danionella cerebrum]|uniref:ADP-ribosylation factor-like protein 16 n=1 Tax=Danionella cerebrum TaxID=2873325 RepID=A0A553QT91_9TELE|nr:hypothetical protein DNTS_006316 [Danionella translucida]
MKSNSVTLMTSASRSSHINNNITLSYFTPAIVTMSILLGATGVGKTLLMKRLQNLCQSEASVDLADVPVTLPSVGTNLTDLIFVRAFRSGTAMEFHQPETVKEKVLFVVDSANVTQISSSCIQLLSVLSAEPLQSSSILVLFNKRDLPCTMSLVEIKSLFRMDDIIRTAPQSIATLEISARTGQGLQEVLHWLFSSRADT